MVLDFLNNKQDLNELINKTNRVHIRLINRGVRKRITIVEGLDKIISKEMINKIMKFMKKKLMCSITYTQNKLTNDKKALHIQGDHKKYIKEFLIKYKLVDENIIETHRFT
jgi:translation initiation factor SUI1